MTAAQLQQAIAGAAEFALKEDRESCLKCGPRGRHALCVGMLQPNLVGVDDRLAAQLAEIRSADQQW